LSARSKSPLHPSALSLTDITPGRRIILFNKEYGIMEEAIVISTPRVERRSYAFLDYTTTSLVVDLRSTKHGWTQHHYLTDMGVIPYSGSSSNPRAHWNDRNFTVDARKRHLLPDPDPSLHDSTWDEIDRMIDEDMDRVFAYDDEL